jgi:phosphoribosylpyrophosphate synthetase
MSEQIYNLRRTFKYFDLKCDVGFYFSDEGYIGDNIKGRDVILFENILRTGQKLKNRALDLKAKGARSIYAFSIHSLTQGHDL